MIYNRLEGEELNVDKWVDSLKMTLAKYNLSVHSRLPNMSPYQARQPYNKQEVMFNNYTHSKNDVIYPLISVDDNVRIRIKKTNKSKGTDPKWTREVYKIINKKANGYWVNNNINKVYFRNELISIFTSFIVMRLLAI